MKPLIGPELTLELEYAIEVSTEEIEDDNDEDGTHAAFIDAAQAALDGKDLNAAQIEEITTELVYRFGIGLGETQKQRREVNLFFHSVGQLEVFDRGAWDRGEVQCSTGRPKICKINGVEYEAVI